MGEEMREVRELYDAEQEKTRSNEEELLKMHNQVLASACTCARSHTCYVLCVCTTVRHFYTRLCCKQGEKKHVTQASLI